MLNLVKTEEQVQGEMQQQQADATTTRAAQAS